jgi:DNA polymerase-1
MRKNKKNISYNILDFGQETTVPKTILKNIMQLEEPISLVGSCSSYTDKPGKYTYIATQEKLDAAVTYLSKKDYIMAVDIETKGLDAYSGCIFLIAFSITPGESFVFDPRKVDATEFAKLLPNLRCIAHNANFEYAWFRQHYNVKTNFYFDTMMGRQMLNAGKLNKRAGLDDCMEEDLGIVVDKTLQKSFQDLDEESPLTNTQIAYCAGDVCWLITLADIYEEKLKKEKLYHIWETLERPMIPILGEHKHFGIPVDVAYAKNLEKEINSVIATKEKELLDFLGYKSHQINIQSPDQLKEILSERGINVEDTNENTLSRYISELTNKESEAAVLINKILDFRGVIKERDYAKQWGTDFLNKKTNCVHASYGQTFTDTGRMNSRDPNAQNIPRDNKFRQMIRPLKSGFKVGILDVSQFEVRILAQASGEQKLIDAFIKGFQANTKLKLYLEEMEIGSIPDKDKEPEAYNKLLAKYPKIAAYLQDVYETDFHRMTASAIYNVPPGQVTKEQRTVAKSISFALPYGASYYTVAQSAGIPEDDAKKIINAYYAMYRRVEKYLNNLKEQAVKEGYTTSLAGRKRYYTVPLAADANTDPDRYKKIMGMIERAATNMPIQATNGDAIKLATILVTPELEKLSSYEGECRIIMWVHDEIVVIAPEEKIKQVATITETKMIQAAKTWLPDVPIEIGIEIADTWKK